MVGSEESGALVLMDHRSFAEAVLEVAGSEASPREQSGPARLVELFESELGTLLLPDGQATRRLRDAYEVFGVNQSHTVALATCPSPVPPYNLLQLGRVRPVVSLLSRFVSGDGAEKVWVGLHPGKPYPVAFGLRGEPWCVLVCPFLPGGEEPW